MSNLHNHYIKFWKPRYKYQLIKWFKDRYPSKSVNQLKKMTYKELYAVYHNVVLASRPITEYQ